MPLAYNGDFQVYKVASMGPYDNNGYVIADPASGECYLVDAPTQIERLILEAGAFRIKGVLITHTHPDHIQGYGDLKRLTGLPAAVHPADQAKLPSEPDFHLGDGDELRIGGTSIHVLHTPGHTPGGVCLRVGGCLISGDTLFPGGPGYTGSPETFRQLVRSITERLLTLDGDMLVFPGHGADTTIGQAKQKYAAFSGRAHPDDIHGHVSWLTS
jgi:glyoxylase-like metal-dependent hydrolase (beta-lactamase superfamily II)